MRILASLFRCHVFPLIKKMAIGSIKRINTFSPHWALITLLRIADKDAIDSLFDRKSVSKTIS
jgi:hypothetical protein